MLSNYKTPGTVQGEMYHLTYTISDFYNLYKKEHKNGLSRKEYMGAMTEFFVELRIEIIEKRYNFRMPFRLGDIRIKKCKHTGDLDAHRIDWKKTKELNKKVYHLNIHTGRYYFKWVWNKIHSGIKVKNRNFYHFRPVRASTRHLAKHIKESSSNPEVRDYDCLQ